MEQRPLRIFISSTTEDLREHRAVAVDAIQRMGHVAVMLEFAEASDRSPLQRSQEMIASCDAFISVIAHRYGFIPRADNPNQYSFVELELRYAWDLGMPTFIFMVNESTPWPPQFSDRDANAERLRKFRKEVLDRRVVGFFDSPDDLARQVAKALASVKPVTPPLRPSPKAVVPSSVDQFELAWRLVVDFKAEPALLASMDTAELLKATERWALETRPDEPLDRPLLFEAAQAQLRHKQATLTPSPLWLAWKRATAAGQAPPQSNA